jgi:threonine dehydrogenase-like Zn-dependent dehydrogenase
MRALTVIPGRAGSARVEEVPEPSADGGTLLVQALAVGVCGTHLEIVSGDYGEPPPGKERLILGHESLGRVIEAPAGSGFSAGHLVVGIVRRPDPAPCPNCAAGECDTCRNGLHTERGIKGWDGYCSERYRLEPAFVVRVVPHLGHLGVLLEPASVVKAWEHVERIGSRAVWQLNKSLVLENDVVFGSVNANRRHYERAAEALARAGQSWLGRLVTRRVPLTEWRDALRRRPDDVKRIIELAAA